MIDADTILGILSSIFAFLAAFFTILMWKGRKPDFIVYFAGGSEQRDLRPNERANIDVEIYNMGKEVAENIEVHLFIPPEFEIRAEDQPGYEPKKKNWQDWPFKENSDSEYPNYWNIQFEFIRLGPGFSDDMALVVKTPKLCKEYPMWTEVVCKGIGSQKHDLVLEVY